VRIRSGLVGSSGLLRRGWGRQVLIVVLACGSLWCRLRLVDVLHAPHPTHESQSQLMLTDSEQQREWSFLTAKDTPRVTCTSSGRASGSGIAWASGIGIACVSTVSETLLCFAVLYSFAVNTHPTPRVAQRTECADRNDRWRSRFSAVGSTKGLPAPAQSHLYSVTSGDRDTWLTGLLPLAPETDSQHWQPPYTHADRSCNCDSPQVPARRLRNEPADGRSDRGLRTQKGVRPVR